MKTLFSIILLSLLLSVKGQITDGNHYYDSNYPIFSISRFGTNIKDYNKSEHFNDDTQYTIEYIPSKDTIFHCS